MPETREEEWSRPDDSVGERPAAEGVEQCFAGAT